MKQALSQMFFTVLLMLAIAITAYGVECFVGIPGSRVGQTEMLFGAGDASIRATAVPIR